MQLRTGLLLCCSIGLLPGCHSYAVVPVEAVAPGTAVRATITAVGADRLRETLGRDDRVLIGTVLDTDPGEILLAVPSASRVAAGPVSRLRQRVAVRREDVLALEVRRLDRWRTAGLVAASAVVGGLVVVSAFGDEEDTAGRPEEGGVDAVRIPVLRLRFW